jgi:solute carrier family 13 (sodium-dependent dicarboxylate transporter), member 2/3/5
MNNARRNWMLLLGPLVGVFLFVLLSRFGLARKAVWCAAVTGLCATWWVTEPIPIPATSLIPFAAFPMLGVLDHKGVATAYGHSLILLLLGGFMLSMGMEKSGAHRRLAMGMVRLVGGAGGRRLVFGFMLASAVLSMWISNTATTLMLLPIALAVLQESEDDALTVPLLLGMAYAASIGGIGTPVGTPPNVIFMGVYNEYAGKELSFVEWMKVGVPVVLLLLPVCWLWLCRGLSGRAEKLSLPEVGPWRPAERRVLWVFAATAVLWVSRSEPYGGWSRLIGAPGVGDSSVALAAVVALFLIPDGEGQGSGLLDWETAKRIPWGLLLLFGGGIAIARAFGASGLSAALGKSLSALASWPVLGMLLVLCLCVTFLTEVTSNTATTSLLMPILAAAALAAKVDLRLLMVPAAISASCAFMLPVATAPNAIVFGTERISTRRMAREGFVLNLFGTATITLVCYALL